MYQKGKKLLAALCMIAMMITALPAIPAKAAAVPKFQKTYASVYENGVDKGQYKYTLINLKKGQTVKWSVSGEGKAYVSVKKTSKKAASSTMLNVITVKTNGKTAAMNKKVTLTAKVYSSAGKLQCTVNTSAKIKVKPTAVTLKAPAESTDTLSVGKSYTFGYKLTPANATSTNSWTVTGEDGLDYSFYMSSTGVFKPMKAGIYTITANAKIGTKTIKSASMAVEVADYMVSCRQTAANKLEVTYSGDVRNSVELGQFTIRNAVGASILAKNLEFSADGKTAILTTYSNFLNATTYTVDDGATSLNFTASVGLPVRLEVLTKQVTVNKETPIEYAIYDSKGIDVTDVYAGTVVCDAEVINGYVKDNKLYMTTVGKTATIKLTYTNKADSTLVLVNTGVVTCISASTSTNTNFTLTDSAAAPDYTASSYTDNRKVSIGKTYYAHFRALDEDKTPIQYTDIKYECSDPDTLIISADGRVTPIKNGSVKIIVTASYAGSKYTYSYDVTIAQAAYLSMISLSSSVVNMSNVYSSDYKQYVDVTAKDQYGESYPLTSETVVITETSTIKGNLLTYDATANQLIVKASNSYAIAGSYSYVITLSAGGKTANANMTVVVTAPPANGALTYQIEMDKHTADLSLNADVAGSKSVNVRLAQYRGGVFEKYISFSNVTITKAGKYYTTDLTAGGTTANQTINPGLLMTVKVLDITSGVCKKAEIGAYTISAQYYSEVAKSYQTLTDTLTLADTQDMPDVRIERTTASKSCGTALELAQNCLSTVTGRITECEVTGASDVGSKVAIKSGDQVNIKSVKVEDTYTISGGQIVTVTYTISIGKTLTNI